MLFDEMCSRSLGGRPYPAWSGVISAKRPSRISRRISSTVLGGVTFNWAAENTGLLLSDAGITSLFAGESFLRANFLSLFDFGFCFNFAT